MPRGSLHSPACSRSGRNRVHFCAIAYPPINLCPRLRCGDFYERRVDGATPERRRADRVMTECGRVMTECGASYAGRRCLRPGVRCGWFVSARHRPAVPSDTENRCVTPVKQDRCYVTSRAPRGEKRRVSGAVRRWRGAAVAREPEATTLDGILSGDIALFCLS